MPDSDVFISYAADTKPLAEQLARALQAQGIHAWVDFQDLQPGQLWKDEVERALERAQSVLIVVSPESRANSWQEAEWRAALVKVWSDSDKRLIPVVVGGTQPPPFLRNWVWLRVDPDAEPANWTRHVINALKSSRDEVFHGPGDRRERQDRLNEISRAVEELAKGEPGPRESTPGSQR